MKDTTPYEVFCKLIGDIHPKGSTVHDAISNVNLDQYCFNVQCLIEEMVDKVVRVPFYGEASISESFRIVADFMDTAICYMKEIREDMEQDVRWKRGIENGI